MRFLLLLLSLISSFAFAADSTSGGFPNTLAPPPGDLSVSLLASIFGVVDGVLHGTGSQILGAMFGVYNAAILTMGMVILVYILIVGTLNTAHEGEVMGKKWSSIWIPLRTVAGVALLLPKASGYSFIQIMVMWIVVQGVGAADMVWARTLDYLGRGGVVVQAPQVFTPEQAAYAQSYSADSILYGGRANGYYTLTPAVTNIPPGTNLNKFLIPIAGTIFKSEVCMYALQNILNNKNKDSKDPKKKQIPFLVNTLKVERADRNSADSRIMYFPGALDLGDGVDYKGMCGSVAWVSSGDDVQLVNKTDVIATDSRSVAIQQIVLNLQPQAQRVANFILPQTGGYVNNINSGVILENLLTDNTLFYATTDYIAIITPYFQKKSRGNQKEIDDFIKEAKAVGWILAGAYYFDISKIKSEGVIKEDTTITAEFPDLSCGESSTNCKSASLKSAFEPVASYLSPKAAQCPPLTSNTINKYICEEYDNNGMKGRGNQANPNAPGASTKAPSPLFDRKVRADTSTSTSIFFSAISFGITGCIETANNLYASMGDIYHAQTVGGNPIIMVAQLGVDLVNTVERIYISTVALILAASILGAAIAFGFSLGVGTALMNVLLWLLPLMSAILLPLLVSGATMAYYVPMIPFILFIFGAMTWFATVIEAMIAAPLVALGLAHPEGHEHLGRAEYAVMLLANVFLRPLLMIFGFITATILSSVMLWLVNYGFTKVWSNVQSDWLGVIYFVATIVVYMTIVLTIINKSFSLIYDVPNKVLRWIGGQAESTGEGAALEEVRAGASKGLETGAQLTGKAADTAFEGAQALGKRAVGLASKAGGGGPSGNT